MHPARGIAETLAQPIDRAGGQNGRRCAGNGEKVLTTADSA
jgi:hypothetical protein